MRWSFPYYDVKNRIKLEFPLDEHLTALIEEYVHDHRAALLRGCNELWLFPGEKRRPQDPVDVLRSRSPQAVLKATGLRLTAHQFRHAAAALMLQARPGNYEWVRRVLGHKNIQTTINFYVGLETTQATERFGKIVRKHVSFDRWGGPAMRSLPIEDWPSADREAWRQACDHTSGCAGWRGRSHEAHHAGRPRPPLRLLPRSSRPARTARSGGAGGCSCRPKRPSTASSARSGHLASVTQAQSIYKLRRMAEILSPGRTSPGCARLEKDLALVAYPRDRFDRVVTTEVLVEAGLTLVKEAQLAVHRRRLWRATQLRNGLMVALLASIRSARRTSPHSPWAELRPTG